MEKGKRGWCLLGSSSHALNWPTSSFLVALCCFFSAKWVSPFLVFCASYSICESLKTKQKTDRPRKKRLYGDETGEEDVQGCLACELFTMDWGGRMQDYVMSGNARAHTHTDTHILYARLTAEITGGENGSAHHLLIGAGCVASP